MKIFPTIVVVSLAFLGLNCGSTTGTSFSPEATGSSATEGAVSGSVGKGIIVEGNVSAPTSTNAEISVGSSVSKGTLTVSKEVVTDVPIKGGSIVCKSYAGALLDRGVVNALGEIKEVVIPASLLDASQQILCEATTSDGKKFLSHFDLTGKSDGDRVVSTVDVASTLATQQVLYQCESSTVFDDLSACDFKMKDKLVEPKTLFEKYRKKCELASSADKSDTVADSYKNLLAALKAGLASSTPPKPGDINKILDGSGTDLLESFKKLDSSLRDWAPDAAISSIKNFMTGALVKKTPESILSHQFQQAEGKKKSRWNFNPLDNRGQGNNGKPEMLDPYGHSKDDRMELYGNRGRVIRKSGPDLSYLYTHYIYVDGWAWWLWKVGGENMIYNRVAYDLETLGYTAEEAAFLLSLDSAWIWRGFLQSFTAMPPVQTTLAPIADLDLKRIVNYIDTNEYHNDLATMSWEEFTYYWPSYGPYEPGDTVEYGVSLTNPYDSPLNLSVKVTIEYMNQHWAIYNRDWSTLIFQFLTGAPLPGESTQVWTNVTLQPGQTLTLDDTYFMPPETFGVTTLLNPNRQFPFAYLYAWGASLNAYTYDVTITDLNTGLIYNDPVASFFGYNGNWSLGGWTTYR